MRRELLKFEYPDELIAVEKTRPSRVAWVGSGPPCELSIAELLSRIEPGDVFVINNTRVEPRRVYAGELEILFVAPGAQADEWQVLFPARGMAVGQSIALPGDVTMTLKEKGLPQTVTLTGAVNLTYFEKYGEPALPPYIQRARHERHARIKDQTEYQTAWAKMNGSSAAPTASLHFSAEDMLSLKSRGVQVVELTLHVGLGTFLPVKADDLRDHKMHSEQVYIPAATIHVIEQAQKIGRRVWALGTTVTRALESWADGRLQKADNGDWQGESDLLIQPGFQFRVVDGLLTNFHQPESTLLALVAGFAGLDRVHEVYQWAIAKRFRLFSYGDLSVWLKPR